MRFYCIADEDTVRGFRLAGIDGETVTTPDQAKAAVDRVVEVPHIGILILTDAVATQIRSRVESIRLEHDRPLVVEIPGPEGYLPGRKTLRQFVQEAVGIRVGQEDT